MEKFTITSLWYVFLNFSITLTNDDDNGNAQLNFLCFLQVKSSSFTRLCSTKNILTVNGEFPGPTLKAHRGDTLIVKVYNQANYNITIHWYVAYQTI